MEYEDEEEGEILPDYVTDYSFVENDLPVSFTILPVLWTKDHHDHDHDHDQSLSNKVFLCGMWDDGLQKLYKHVIAWKFNLICEQPEIYVLTYDKRIWIKLLKCRKSYEPVIRTALITLYWLDCVKKLPADKSPWNHLRKIFSSHDVEPSEADLLNHLDLIKDAADRDKDLANSRYLLAFNNSPETSNEGVQMPRTEFIDDEIEYQDNEVNEDEMEDDFFDPVCAICDNGGSVLRHVLCEGKCLRSFHPTILSGAESGCNSLGFANDAEYEAIPVYLCKNCLHKQHQCFACGKLGSSDDENSGQEVFQCISATCGHFYHPECVAKLLHPNSTTRQEKARESIAAKNPFNCPAHKCLACNEDEDKNDPDLQFALCRRCPKAFHRKCLPQEIRSPNKYDSQRAWNDLLPNRILMYCLSHEIDINSNTPSRDHLRFPNTRPMGKKPSIKFHVSERNVVGTAAEKLKHVQNACGAAELQGFDMIENAAPKEYSDPSRRSNVTGPAKQSSKKNRATTSIRPSIPDKNKLSVNSSSSMNTGSYPAKSKLLSTHNKKIENAVPDKLKANKFHGSEPVDPERGNVPCASRLKKQVVLPSKIKMAASDELKMKKVQASELLSREVRNDYTSKFQKQIISPSTAMNAVPDKPQIKNHSSESIDPAIKEEINDLIEEVSASFNAEEFRSRLKIPSTCASSSKNFLDKKVTLGFIQSAEKAVLTASKMLEKGCSTQEAINVCPPELLKKLHSYKKKFRVYLAPFLHGSRYTPFGRHFTKKDKLVQIVDFCCGNNDFSYLMKKKLEKVGKSCSFKNFDLIPPKNDFCFEKRDWMSIRRNEMPDGDQLIIGLNPPFGVKAALANKFIDKALKFSPKLIVLIVPRETTRINEIAPYDLIWEDDGLLAGNSFYLPGSVDVNDSQSDQWNNIAPPLYLWSRRDMTAKHKSMALSFGHISNEQGNYSCSFSKLFVSGPEEVKRHKGLTNNESTKKESGMKMENEVSWQSGDLYGQGGISSSSSACVDMETSPKGSPVNQHKAYDSMELGDEEMDGYMRQLRSPDSEFHKFGSLAPPPPIHPSLLPPPPPLRPGHPPPPRVFSPGHPPPPRVFSPGHPPPPRVFSPGPPPRVFHPDHLPRLPFVLPGHPLPPPPPLHPNFVGPMSPPPPPPGCPHPPPSQPFYHPQFIFLSHPPPAPPLSSPPQPLYFGSASYPSSQPDTSKRSHNSN
ncbi:hypothetical protein ACFE04_018233 [Oxalis oulophora]